MLCQRWALIPYSVILTGKLDNACDVEATVQIMPTVVLSDNNGLRLINFRPKIRDVRALS